MSQFATNASLSDGLIWAKTIPFTNQPQQHVIDQPMHGIASVLNYSQFFEKLSAEEQAIFTPPSDIQTGDIVVINGGVRGVGSHYAVWLHEGLFDNGDLNLGPFEKTKSRKREREPLDPFAFGLNEAEVRQLRKLLATEWHDRWEADLKDLLQERAPALLESLNSGDEGVMEAFTSLHFADDKPSLYSEGEEDENEDEEEDEDEDEDEEVELQDGCIYPADAHFQRLPAPAYPRLVARRALAALPALPFLQLYLFAHLDEYGYAAPPAVSMASLGYFRGESNARTIDLALLPPPLRTGTACGLALDRLQQKLPKKDRKPDGIADFEFEGNNAIQLMGLEEASRYFGADHRGHCPLRITREIFRGHAERVRERLLAFLPEEDKVRAFSEAEVDGLVAQMLPVFA